MMNLRHATINDLPLLQHWDKQPHVIASGHDDDWEWETELLRTPEWREQFIAEVDGEPIGIIQIIDPQLEETHYWGDIGSGYRALDIWIGEAHNLGKGYGTEMMNLVIKRCFDDPKVHSILVDPLTSNTRAHNFYEQRGFIFLEKRKFDDDDCFVYLFKK